MSAGMSVAMKAVAMMPNDSVFLAGLEQEVEELRVSIEELKLRSSLIDSGNRKAKTAFRLAIEALSREHKIKSDWYRGLAKCSEGGATNEAD